jgi:A118 family predicted phage portal protein
MQFNMEYGLAKGGLIFRPYMRDKTIAVDYLQADQFHPITFDGNGNLISVVFTDQIQRNDKWYTRLEYHRFEGDLYMITNAAFVSTSASDLGSKIVLQSVPEWEELQDEVSISGITQPLYGYYRVPMANNIDPTSPLGVSVYARAVDLIEEADRQWTRVSWEYESGERTLFVDETAFDRDANNEPILPNRRLYRSLKASGGVAEDFFEAWSPEFRDENLWNGLDGILEQIEQKCGLAFGTLVTNPEMIARTATEIKQSKQRTFLTITNNQKAIQRACDDLLYAMDTLATLYKLAPKGKYEAAYSFDDSIVSDRDTEFTQNNMQIAQGTMSKVEFIMWDRGVSKEQAMEILAEIDAEKKVALDMFSTVPEDEGV